MDVIFVSKTSTLDVNLPALQLNYDDSKLDDWRTKTTLFRADNKTNTHLNAVGLGFIHMNNHNHNHHHPLALRQTLLL